MTFGVTSEGFKAKRLADIREETLTAWRQKFGEGFALPDNSPEGQIKGILDERISLLWELAEANANSYVPSFAENTQLDNVLALTGLTRLEATKSVVSSGKAFGTFGTVLPAGTVISVSGNAASRFASTASAIINNAGVDEIQKIAFDITPTSGKFNIVFPEGTTADIAWNASAAAITNLCESVLGISNIVVTGTIDSTTGLTLTYGGTLGLQDRAEITISGNTLDAGGAVTATPSTDTEGTRPFSDPITLEAEDTGEIFAPAGSLTVIETAVAGLETFTNLLDEDPTGRNRETDQEAKLRRNQILQLAGSATPDAIRADILEVEDVVAVVVFENDTDIVDLDGRPPHSIDVVVRGGVDQEIGEALWDTRAAGIESIGDITVSVIDDEGFSQDVKFSRPTPIDIYVIVDVVTNAAYPINGDDLIKDAIIQNYASVLSIGDDVIVLGSDPSLSCSIGEVPGMESFSVKVGTSPSPTLSDNIAIAAREIADFDTSRITVNS